MSLRPIIGAHVSSAGGLPNAVLAARHIGAEAIQLFGSSPRQWAVRLPDAKTVTDFRAAVKRASLQSVFLHAPYLINLATTNKVLWKKSVALLTATMKISEIIGGTGVIVHVGSGEGGLFREQTLLRAAAGLKQVLRNAPGKSFLIIENSAGGGEKVGKDLPEIAWLVKRVASKRIGVCIDTAHAFESGIAEYSKSGVEKLAKEIEATFGFERLVALHANDSKTAFGSKNDRHENIGKGFIGADGFKHLLAHPQFRKIPFILEVPGYGGMGPDKKNVDVLKGLAGG